MKNASNFLTPMTGSRLSPGASLVFDNRRRHHFSASSSFAKYKRRRGSLPRGTALSLSLLSVGLLLFLPQRLLEVVDAQEAPSFVPSDAPSLVPTAAIAPVPSNATETPTPQPAASPDPTPLPTIAVPDSPAPTTAEPTAQPNPAPTTPEPTTAEPTMRPTRRPTTASPTVNPTTFDPTTEPTTSQKPTTSTPRPTMSPAPTSAPIMARPSRRPSPVETDAPSSESTAEPKVTQRVNLTMTMEVMSHVMKNRSVIMYEQVTTDFIRGSILTQNFGNAPLTFLDVITVVDAQEIGGSPPASIRQRALQLQQRTKRSDKDRDLQEQQPSSQALRVASQVLVEYRSTKTDYSAVIWVSGAFNSPSKRESYVSKLVATNDPAFENLRKVDVLVDGKPPVDQPEVVNPSESNGAMIGIIVGSVVGGILLIALAIVGARRMGALGGDKSTAGKSGSHGNYPTSATSGYSQPGPLPSAVGEGGDPRYTTEIIVNERPDDISTIGDPFVYGGMMMTTEELSQRDERTASVGDNYDYANQFLRESSSSTGTRTQTLMAGGLAATQSGAMRSSSAAVGATLLSDDDSFEQQYAAEDLAEEERFEVEAPPGKLGMVIDTPNGGVPVVHALKSESILADQVEVGDHLLSVDGEDVTGMTALEVSRLISLKSDQSRVLVFSRSPSIPKRNES